VGEYYRRHWFLPARFEPGKLWEDAVYRRGSPPGRSRAVSIRRWSDPLPPRAYGLHGDVARRSPPGGRGHGRAFQESGARADPDAAAAALESGLTGPSW